MGLYPFRRTAGTPSVGVMVEWVAQMVTPAVDLVAPVFRRTVDLDHGTVTSAVLHVSSLGVPPMATKSAMSGGLAAALRSPATRKL